MSTPNITAAHINKLRQATGAGMLDCKKALTETKGDFEMAIDWLRKHGQKVAAKRSDRETKEGVVLAKTSIDNQKGYILCLSCETDFVSKNDEFVSFANSILNVAIERAIPSLEALLNEKINTASVSDLINDKVASIGEKITISRFEMIEAPAVFSYVHGNNRIAVLVGLSNSNEEVGKDIAMQIAAMNPTALDEKSIPAEAIEREKSVINDLMLADPSMKSKPAEMLAKIVEGKLKTFFKEQSLLAQAFVKDTSYSVKDYITKADKNLSVINFKRVALGG